MSVEKPSLYTNESIVFRSGITNADLSIPITVVEDAMGNHLLQDGNHRAKRSELTGEPLERAIIGKALIDASEEDGYRLIADLKVVDK